MDTMKELEVVKAIGMVRRVKTLPRMRCTPREPYAWRRRCRKQLQKLLQRLHNPTTPAPKDRTVLLKK